jgi:hypothetical protein
LGLDFGVNSVGRRIQKKTYSPWAVRKGKLRPVTCLQGKALRKKSKILMHIRKPDPILFQEIDVKIIGFHLLADSK